MNPHIAPYFVVIKQFLRITRRSMMNAAGLRKWTMVLLAAGLFSLLGTQAKADTVTLTFNPPDFEWNHPSGGATPYHIWVTGDYWAQNFVATGLSSATSMSLHLFIDDNTLTTGNLVNLNVLLNGIGVGNFSIPSGLSGDQTFNFGFSTILGPNYRIQLLETNTVPPGAGALSIGLQGRSFAQLTGGPAVPEPMTLLLLGTGLAGVAGNIYRRKRIESGSGS